MTRIWQAADGVAHVAGVLSTTMMKRGETVWRLMEGGLNRNGVREYSLEWVAQTEDGLVWEEFGSAFDLENQAVAKFGKLTQAEAMALPRILQGALAVLPVRRVDRIVEAD